VRHHDDLTVLLLGWSSFAERRVVPALARLGVTRVDVASATRTPALPAPLTGRAFTSYADALTSSAATLVYVSTRNHEHVSWARRALESGRHVVVDKPAVLEQADAHALVDLSHRQQRLVAEATVYPWHPQFDVARELIAAHGPLTRLTATFVFPRLPEHNFRHRAQAGGGTLYDLGAYALTPGRVFFDAAPTTIDATAVQIAGDEVETAFSVLLTYPGQRTLIGHFGSPGSYTNRLELSGPRFALTMDRAFTSTADQSTRIVGVAGNQPIAIDVPAADAMARFLDDVITSAGTGRHERFATAMLADAAALARLRAAARRSPVTVIRIQSNAPSRRA